MRIVLDLPATGRPSELTLRTSPPGSAVMVCERRPGATPGTLPPGPFVVSAVVGQDGRLTLDGVEPDTDYWAARHARGRWSRVLFRTPREASSAPGGAAVRAAVDTPRP